MTSPARLEGFARSTSLGDLQRLRGRIATHLDVLEEQRFDNEFVQVQLAQKIVAVLTKLVDSADVLDAHQRGLLRGAIEYFVLTEDDDDDVHSQVGMEDDLAVANELCRALGREDLLIDAP